MYCDVPRLFVSADSDCRLRLLTDLFLVRLYIRYSGNVALHHPVFVDIMIPDFFGILCIGIHRQVIFVAVVSPVPTIVIRARGIR